MSPDRSADVVAIVGASSGIGRALARAFAESGRSLVLAGRDTDSLERIAADCRVRYGVAARAERFEALDFDGHAAFFERLAKGFGDGIGGVVLCYGEMSDEEHARSDRDVLRRMVDINYTSAVSVLECAAAHFGARGAGFVCALTSVAGDRGRPRNHVYGSTKAALATYLAGLRARLSRRGVSVVTVKPGVVDTAMTWGLPDRPLLCDADRVAGDTVRAIAAGRAVVYTPWFWRWVMAVIRLLPDRIFNRLDL